MANTIMTAKNSFLEGLIMDFAPDNTQATCMTSALNATLLTFNGNEMSLLNDMGNGRVETARLPEGYIPVGTCEFGDIIYIVSYNPIINKSLIGCFPSPERNISSEEIGGLQQSLSWKDFLKGTNVPNGELKASSVKKILYDSKDMTPGDKYIIYSKDLELEDNNKYLSDYNNPTHEHGTFPKLAKIHVVSIEESGKIVYLDSTTKWYDNNDYYLNADLSVSGEIKDLDSYRTMVSSAYSVFSSKVSGKLALLIELEKITGFSCSWEPYINSSDSLDSEGLKYTNYSIYWNFNWTTDDYNINPNGAILTLSEWTGVDKNRKGQYLTWTYNGKYEIDLLENSVWKSVTCPSSYETIISRNYQPEIHSTASYSTFLSTYEYNNYQLRIINNIKQGDVEPYKLNILKLEEQPYEGQPYEGHYYVNCTSIIEGVPKTTNSTGQLVNAWNGSLNDDIVNNYFHYPVIKKFANFNIPTKQIFKEGDNLVSKTPYINNLIYHYKIAPTMPYGILDEYTQEGYIDFSKIGTKSIALNTWKYYNYENTSTLTWGMEAYTEPGKGISEVVFEFYDNQGFVAAYHNKGKNSYNGTFTEYLTLNESGSNYKLNNIPAFPIDKKNPAKYHRGIDVTKNTATPGFKYQKKVTTDLDSLPWVDYIDLVEGETYYLDDSGTLYSNFLYLVKIIVKYCNKGVLDEYLEPIDENSDGIIKDYRWFWTNTMFNEYYNNTLDFKDLLFILNLNCNTLFKTLDNYEVKRVHYFSPIKYDESITADTLYKSLSANVQYINLDGTLENNILMSIEGGLENDFNTFNLNIDKLSEVKATVFLAKDYLINNPELANLKFSKETVDLLQTEILYPVNNLKDSGKITNTVSSTLSNLISSEIEGKGEELYYDKDSYKNYKNTFLLTSTEKISKELTGNIVNTNNGKNKLQYISSEGLVETEDFILYEDLSLSDSKFNFTLSGIHYSKYAYLTELTEIRKQMRSFVLDELDLTNYNISIYNGATPFFNKALFVCAADRPTKSASILGDIVNFNSPNHSTTIEKYLDRQAVDAKLMNIHLFLNKHIDNISSLFRFLFPFCYGDDNIGSGEWNTGDPYIVDGKLVSEVAHVKDNKDYTNRLLGGTLGGIVGGLKIEPGNHHTSVGTNALTSFIPIVLGYLTLLFYVNETEPTISHIPSNYVFLENNYCSYKRDIVIKLYTKIKKELLLIRGMYYSLYLEKIKEKCGIDINLNDSNINIKFEDCLKTFPLEFKFDYIKPNMLSIDKIISISSIFLDIPSSVVDNYSTNNIYTWNIDKFVSINDVRNLKKINNLNVNLDGSLSALLQNNYNTFSLGTIGNQSLLAIDSNNCLSFRKLPSLTSGTYKIKMRDRYLTNYLKSITYYK